MFLSCRTLMLLKAIKTLNKIMNPKKEKTTYLNTKNEIMLLLSILQSLQNLSVCYAKHH